MASIGSYNSDSAYPLAPLQGRDVHLWCVPIQASSFTASHFEALLAPDEKVRADSFRLDRLRSSFIITRGALRTILGFYLGTSPSLVQFTYGAHGKPVLDPDTGLSFSLSHSGDLAVIATTLGCDLGVDVEHTRPIKDMQQIANRFFGVEEAAELMSVSDAERQRAFFLCWTRKEAYIKATGEGFSAALDSFRVSLLSTQPTAMIHIGGCMEAARQWTLHHLEPASTYLAALAYNDQERPLIIRAVPNPLELLAL